MALWHLILLAVLQGVTEFLPISSSGHLILLPALTGLQDQGPVLDVAVHVGTLGAVVLFLRDDVGRALAGTLGLLRGRFGAAERLAAALAVATVPVILAGLAIQMTIGSGALRSVALIGWTTLGFGLLLWWFDRRGGQAKALPDWSLSQAAKLGLWQAVALIPGTSRSGICITGARAMGYDRHEAARIAMLMSIPTIFASGVLLSLDVAAEADGAVARDAALAALMAFGAALLALKLMFRLLQSVSFTPYVIYRIALGTVLLAWAYS
ncbi:undecaprenyl-diphosphate phosphatase [Jannaschia ovalis]|uniref:Undecaprenyl-diphosphatase n=1 Tax=Jannaschia ovalis TaxID=3038773 RepID=A0ABY8L6X0_9RHOB|nr:undecaprenyl-diphosphate phosphatase [Jannaschia sp. GRR-S6-38]WGH77142.1 undecaprenyl-diphosphate phosphatase [Jannaschia sp. GRR-S6-38]